MDTVRKRLASMSDVMGGGDPDHCIAGSLTETRRCATVTMSSTGGEEGSRLAPIAPTVPALPGVHGVRNGILDEVLESLLAHQPSTVDKDTNNDTSGFDVDPKCIPETVAGATLSAELASAGICRGFRQRCIVTAHGMGGSGKTVMAAAVCRSSRARKHFSRTAFVTLGQTPELLMLQREIYSQVRISA